MSEHPKYQISTLRDIFALPTIEAMERCIRELGGMMVSARAYSEMMEEVARHLAEKDGRTIPPGPFFIWPESAEWMDDGGLAGTSIKFTAGEDLLTEMRITKASP